MLCMQRHLRRLAPIHLAPLHLTPLHLVQIVLTALCTLGCAAAARSPQVAPADQPTLRIMTYNINFGGRGDPQALAAVRAGDPDVVFLQETTPAWERAFKRAFSTDYPHQRWLHVRGGAGGMAVMSRWPLALEPITAGPGWFDALRAEVEDDGILVSTISVREAELRHHAVRLKGDAPLIVLGDFNEDDAGRGVTWLSKARGLSNALMQFDPDAETWRWPTWAMELTDTFDHVLYDARLTCLNARVIDAGRSDHRPVVAEFMPAAAQTPRPPAPSH